MPEAGATTRRRGPRPRFTIEEILDAAELLPHRSLTMAALAESLGLATSALYRYVRDREQLLELLTARLSHVLPLPSAELSWDEWLRVTTREVYDTLLAHPLLFDLGAWSLVGGSGPQLRLRGNQVLRQGGFTDVQADLIYNTCTQLAFVHALSRTAARGQLDLTEAGVARLASLLEGGTELLIAGCQRLAAMKLRWRVHSFVTGTLTLANGCCLSANVRSQLGHVTRES